MKLAFISDVHGNWPALQAVLADIELREPDDIYCLGDLVNFAGWDNEVIEAVRSHGITTVQGNHDEGIGYQRSLFPYSYSTEAQREFGERCIRLTAQQMTAVNRLFLRNLPFSVKMEYRLPFHPVRIMMVHGSPVSNNDYVHADTPDEELQQLLNAADADILLMGHTHRPFHRTVFSESGNSKQYRHVINAGSVGKPKNQNPSACYALLELREEGHLSDPDAILVTFHYVPYNVEAVLNHIHARGLGHAYDHALRTGL